MIQPNCEQCPFKGSQKIGGEGYIEFDNKLAVCHESEFPVVGVAMAPATEELRQGRILIGPSGQFLRKHLHQLGIKKYYLTNTLMCSIPEEATEEDIRAAAQCCLPRLLDEIQSKKQLLTLALGELPFHTLAPDLKDYKISEVEGRVLPSLVGALQPLMHPAYYLRRPEEAFDFIECLRSGASVLSGTYQQATEVSYALVRNDNVNEIRDLLWKSEFIAVDTETTGFNAYGIHPNEILEMGLAISHEHSYIVPKELIPAFKDILESKKCLFWNALFDYAFIRAGSGICPNIYFDGMLAHYCLDERPSKHGLKRCARIYTGSDDWEKGIAKYLPNKKTSSYSLIPHDVRNQYLAYDAARTYQMWEILEHEVKDNWVFWHVLMPATRMFADIIHKGIRLDPNKILTGYQGLQEELEERQKELFEIAGQEFNVLSPKQVAEILYDKIGLKEDPAVGRTTARPILETRKNEHIIIEKLIEYREQAKTAGTYIAGIASFMDNDYRIHPKFKLFGTVTGRISCEEPSVMNIKGESLLKSMYLPEPGQLFAELDAKQMELRWYSIYAEDEILKEILMKPGDAGDPHFQIGLIAFGGDEDKSRNLRTATKMVVFGRVYMRGFDSIVNSYGAATAQAICDAMDKMMPNHKKYVKNIREKVRTQGYVTSYFGRTRRFPLITQENRGECERQAVNMPIQSGGSDLNILNMIYLYENRKKWNIWPMWPIHDSLNVSVPDEEAAKEVQRALEENALNIMEGKMPFKYKMEVGPDWSMGKAEKSTYYKRLMREGKDTNIPKSKFVQN